MDAAAGEPAGRGREPARSAAGSRRAASARPVAARGRRRPTAPTRLILVRHGETELTAAAALLRPRRRAAVRARHRPRREAAAARVAALAPAVAAVVTSPLARCRATAEADRRGARAESPVSVEPDLIECDFGDWEGLTFAEVRRALAGRDGRAGSARPAVAPPGGESFAAGRRRGCAGRWRGCGERTRRQTVVVVSPRLADQADPARRARRRRRVPAPAATSTRPGCPLWTSGRTAGWPCARSTTPPTCPPLPLDPPPRPSLVDLAVWLED